MEEQRMAKGTGLGRGNGGGVVWERCIGGKPALFVVFTKYFVIQSLTRVNH
jgi:hypothetical protein